jgi:hypothetical protein
LPPGAASINPGPPGRPYGLAEEAKRIIGEIKMPRTMGSVADRIRAKDAAHGTRAEAMHAQLDEIDAMEEFAIPVLDRVLAEQVRSVESMHNDAKAMEEAATELLGSNRGPTVSSTQPAGSGSVGGNGVAKTEGEKP